MNIEEEHNIEKRNRENLVYTYREELHKIIKGHNCKVIPSSVRHRMREYGILKKFGNKYRVTQLGKELLNDC